MRIKIQALTMAMAATAISFSGFAATPADGVLTLDNQVIEYSEGPNFGSNPTPDTGAPECVDTVLPCDTFNLTIDLPERIAEFFPSSLIRIVIDADDPTGSGAEDYDTYLYDADGNITNESVNGGVPESMVELAYGGVTEYQILVAYYTALGSTYTGRVELVLGEPSEDKTQEEIDDFLRGESVVAQALNPDSDVEASPRAAQRMAGGAFGNLMMLFGLVALIRRRHG